MNISHERACFTDLLYGTCLVANPFNALLGLIAVVSIATGDRFTFTFMFL